MYHSGLRLAVSLSIMLVVSVSPALAQEPNCKPEQFAALIDGTGAYLRDFSANRRPALHKKFETLAAKRGWPAKLARDKGYRFVRDKRTAAFDQRARKLIIELDRVDPETTEAASCDELERLKKVTMELRVVTEAKFKHMMARVEQALKPPTRNARVPTAKPASSPWQTRTESNPAPPPSVALSALPPLEPMPVRTTYTSAEIRAAGQGFFGNISAGLASVIQYAFKNYGAPNGYILGSEGGGAFLAGLSFGKGRLTTKAGTSLKVYWQGPSVGYDLGVQGGRVMFLVYNLKQPEQIFRRYAGIGGSAYVVGGAGLTYHKRGKVVLAPIRTGLGLRVGASIGYLKFTPRLSINPF